jgi:hypothetical protein
VRRIIESSPIPEMIGVRKSDQKSKNMIVHIKFIGKENQSRMKTHGSLS